MMLCSEPRKANSKVCVCVCLDVRVCVCVRVYKGMFVRMCVRGVCICVMIVYLCALVRIGVYKCVFLKEKMCMNGGKKWFFRN